MKVIVKESGFYGGTWHKASVKEVHMPEGVARQFMAPYGHQLEQPKAEAKRPSKEAAKDKE